MRVWLRSLPFLLLFPGYLAYHWAAINDLTPLFLGGFVNEASALVCAGFLFVLFCKRIQISRLTSLDILFLIFMIWFAFVVLLNFTLMTAPGVTKNHTAAFLQISATYLAARHIALDQIRRALLWMAVLLGVSIIWVASISPIELLVAGSDESSIANYQSLSRTFLITAIFGLSCIRMQFFRLTGYLLVVIVSFLLGARSELIGLFIFIPVFEAFLSKHPTRNLLFFAVSVIFGITAVYSSLDFLIELLPDNRVLYLLQLGTSDESVVARSVAQQIAWNAIFDSPLFGNYGHYEREASAGFYAHDWLGVWVDLGLLGLVLFFSLHAFAAWRALRIYSLTIKSNNEFLKQRLALAMGLLAMVIVFNLFAKNFTDTGWALAMGFLASLVNNHQSNRKRIKNSAECLRL